MANETRGRPKKKKELKEKNPVGRPKIYDSNIINKDLKVYMENSEDPYIEEFILQNAFTADTFYRLAKENKDLSDTIKRVHAKQLMRTVRKAEAGVINPTFAIFKLKQKCYGWTDKQEIEHSGEMKVTNKTELYEKYLKEE
jgi:hypothetical protein